MLFPGIGTIASKFSLNFHSKVHVKSISYHMDNMKHYIYMKINSIHPWSIKSHTFWGMQEKNFHILHLLRACIFCKYAKQVKANTSVQYVLMCLMCSTFKFVYTKQSLKHTLFSIWIGIAKFINIMCTSILHDCMFSKYK